MTRPKLFLLIGIAFAVVVIGVIVTALVLRYALPEPVTDRLSEHALTPEETFTEVAPHRDGSVQMRQRLIFESPSDDGGPVGLWISDAALGRNVQSGNRLAMMPKISSLSAVELSTADDSTRSSPKTLGELDITVDEKKTEGFDHPAAHFMFSPKDSQDATVEWSKGRHVIELE
ncbi:hypothetical protein [Brevibacterium spongiae]|uniref:DUF2771 domain-containing protein n=1 Tax=Brevibacterium spongiae TaxID=2909672 RepID=A0ABY5SPK9_9MICO|nr:hypothetical protein [Brevibacterium spongiae]UVI34986.1 hypothetical protein L1F31_12755 [Brevibacterium spongiae]